jgi:hypothetical protein
MSEATFIVRGNCNANGTIKNINMIVDTNGDLKFDQDNINGALLAGITETGKSVAKPNVYVVAGDPSNIDVSKTLSTDLFDSGKALASVTGGERRSRRSNHSKRAGRKQRNKSRRI